MSKQEREKTIQQGFQQGVAWLAEVVRLADESGELGEFLDGILGMVADGSLQGAPAATA